MSKDLSHRVANGSAAWIPSPQRDMRPFMAIQLCIGEQWATVWEYRLPLDMNKGKEMILLKEVSEDLLQDALDRLGIEYGD